MEIGLVGSCVDYRLEFVVPVLKCMCGGCFVTNRESRWMNG